MSRQILNDNTYWGVARKKVNENFVELYEDKHNHTNETVLDNTTASYTTAEETKLGNITDNFKGMFADATARDAAIAVPTRGIYCLQDDTDTIWFYDGSAWINTGSNSVGDMLASIYDPTNIASDTFDRANHTGSQNINTITNLGSASVLGTGDVSLPAKLTVHGAITVYDVATIIGKANLGSYIKIGSNSPYVKLVKVTGTTSSSTNSDVNVSTIVDKSKVLSIGLFVEQPDGARMPPNFTGDDQGVNFTYFYNNSSQLCVRTGVNADSRILGRPFTALITYEE